MENAVDALYMAFAVIAFVIALSVSIFAFSNVTTASQRIIDARDKTSMYTYVEAEGTARKVTSEDIIPTLYRAYYENYMIRFVGFESLVGENGLYKVKVEEKDETSGIVTTVYKPTYIIDLEGQKIGNHRDANNLITALLQGNLKKLFEDRIRFSYFEYLQSGSFYDILKGKEFKEEIGLYYMEDKINSNEELKKNVEDVNKNKKRIITYTYPYKKD